ncbi:hypothetical protein LH29_00515 [Draconibacterium sediminis]|uniref:Uncharacterized protein n=1 Tax=Draconibacterium sediminis TaxID=1544798 RepID=A0A0D8JAW9_9BACT|nr:hypothetical protein LH29_00515 [Draconibacterium sediminis]
MAMLIINPGEGKKEPLFSPRKKLKFLSNWLNLYFMIQYFLSPKHKHLTTCTLTNSNCPYNGYYEK